MSNYRLLELKKGDLTLANPADINDLLRFTAKTTRSNVNGVSVTRYQGQLISNWSVAVAACTDKTCPVGSVTDSIRVYLSLSDSQENNLARIEHAISLLNLAKNDLSNGFVPNDVVFPILPETEAGE